MSRRRAFTLLEVTVALAVVVLAARLLLPRLADLDAVALDTAARQLADAIAFGRERAVLGGAPMRLVLAADGGGAAVGRPTPTGVGSDRRTITLPARARVHAVTIGDLPARTPVAIDFAPEGDALPVHLELRDARGRAARVLVPPGSGRARVVHAGDQ